ncbi:YncE family protein [Leptolyngbya sp. FACHB-36]|uniref:YncE family protein n=1 Tax=Leptolyngbya sp. FACHB-36 TaxID=2692808 RepID=UPI0016803064|nr:YncE family protein [Leptolyngbya sp. FACHB-36]MBD2020247.1 YncE family protein [Leptolyngbya sp. FACHB-36]
MAESNLVQLAQRGDADAIAQLMNTSLRAIGVRARAARQGGDLHVLLEANQVLPPQSCIEFLRSGMMRLGVALSSAVIYSRVEGQAAPAWVQRVNLLPLALANPFVLAPDARLEANSGFRLLSWGRGRLFDLLLLSMPLWLVLCSGYIWSKYLASSDVASRAPVASLNRAGMTIAPPDRRLELQRVISGGIAPQSIIQAGNQFFVANGAASHSLTVYNPAFQVVKTLSAKIALSDAGFAAFPGQQQGVPVAAAADSDGQSVWVANERMDGAGFRAPTDDCNPSQNQSPSFLYRIPTQTLSVSQVVQVGTAPRAIATSRGLVLASNWCSWDVSVVDTQKNQEVRRIQVGPYPRGIAVDAKSETAYVAVMGADRIAAIALKDFSVRWLRDVGRSPRYLVFDPAGKYLYVSLGEGYVAKLDVATQTVVSRVATGNAPRSLAISSDGASLYVVNYHSNTVSKIRTEDMAVVQTQTVNAAPIGVAYDATTRRVWVACASGSILVFTD